jgi:enoyl-CoA hydratase/carnithine racemase
MEQAESGTPWFKAPAILTEQGNDPWHDRKSPGDKRYDQALKDKVLDRILAVLLARTYFVVDGDICAPTELNWMTRTALGFSSGLLDVAAELGADKVFELCDRYRKGHDGFVIPKSIEARSLVPFKANVRALRRGDIGVLEVFRPEVKNALSARTIDELDAGLAELVSDSAVKGIVFTSYDGSLAGADIQELAVLPSADECRATCTRVHPIMKRFAECPKPLVAAVNGPVLGGGAEFSMACHARVMGPRTVVGQPEVNLGIIPGYGGTMRLPRLVGFERGAEMIRTARAIDAKTAADWGWGQLADGDVFETAAALIRSGDKLPRLSPEPMAVPTELPVADIGHRSLAIDAIVVDVMRRGLAMSLDDGLNVEAGGFGRCRETVDMDVGMKNFQQNGPRVPAVFLHE